MDQWLAQVYGTNAPSNDDLEKTAQAVMLEKLAAEEGVSLEGLSEEQLEALAQEVLGQAGGGEQVSELDQEMAVKEAQAKFEEADFLGRVMAHSYTQELDKIAMEKAAAAKPGLLRRAGDAVVGAGKRYGELMAGGKRQAALATSTGKGRTNVRPGNVPFSMTGKGVKENTRLAKTYGADGRAASEGAKAARTEGIKSNLARVGTGAAVVGGGAYAASGGKDKKASAFDTLAEQRALAILAEHGIDPSQGQGAEQGQQQVSQEEQTKLASEEYFNNALEQRAWEMLQEHGYASTEDGGQGEQQE